jgi:hypothetical protein
MHHVLTTTAQQQRRALHRAQVRESHRLARRLPYALAALALAFATLANLTP